MLNYNNEYKTPNVPILLTNLIFDIIPSLMYCCNYAVSPNPLSLHNYLISLCYYVCLEFS